MKRKHRTWTSKRMLDVALVTLLPNTLSFDVRSVEAVQKVPLPLHLKKKKVKQQCHMALKQPSKAAKDGTARPRDHDTGGGGVTVSVKGNTVRLNLSFLFLADKSGVGLWL